MTRPALVVPLHYRDAAGDIVLTASLTSLDSRWPHDPTSPCDGVSFTPSVIVDGVVYLASIDGQGRSILYALNASNGAEYWHNHYPHMIAPLAIA